MGGGGGPGFLDLTWAWDVECFFKSFELLEDMMIILGLGVETGVGLDTFGPGDFLPPLEETVTAGGFFSIGAGSFFSGSGSSIFSSSTF